MSSEDRSRLESIALSLGLSSTKVELMTTQRLAEYVQTNSDALVAQDNTSTTASAAAPSTTLTFATFLAVLLQQFNSRERQFLENTQIVSLITSKKIDLHPLFEQVHQIQHSLSRLSQTTYFDEEDLRQLGVQSLDQLFLKQDQRKENLVFRLYEAQRDLTHALQEFLHGRMAAVQQLEQNGSLEPHAKQFFLQRHRLLSALCSLEQQKFDFISTNIKRIRHPLFEEAVLEITSAQKALLQTQPVTSQNRKSSQETTAPPSFYSDKRRFMG